MSNKIYFSDERKSKSISYYVVKTLSNIAYFIAPTFAKKQTQKLLLTPMLSKKLKFTQTDFEQHKLATHYGDLNLYRVGQGPKVVFTHGWAGGAAQFFPLMEKIAEAGYEAIAFDYLAHGNSGGEFSNLPLFIKGLSAVLNHEGKGNLACIVSHSMGTVSALNQDKSIKHLLIAPTFGFYQSFEQRILSTGLKSHLFYNLLSDIEQEHDLIFNSLLPESHLSQTKQEIHIVHDEGDKFAPFYLTLEQASQFKHVQLTATTGLGHGRVINSEHTWQAFMSLMKVA